MQMAFQESHNPISDDFLDQMLSSLPNWPDLDGSNGCHFAPFDESALLASRLRQHQISGGAGDLGPPADEKATGFHKLSQQQQEMILSSMGKSPAFGAVSSPAGGGGGGGDPVLLPLPLTLGSNGGGLVNRSMDEVNVNATSLKSPFSAGSEGLFNGFGGSLNGTANQPRFINQSQNFGVSSAPAAQGGAEGGAGGGLAPATAAAPRQRVRARRGQATDPHSIAERLRRERIAERMKALQELVPNANKTDKASMLDEIIDFVKFLQLQVKVLSMSRLGGAAAVAPLVADISFEAGRRGGGGGGAPVANDSLTVTEQQVAKLMEEDMGSAMQYLQGKGLCLMPISLASAISTATCHSRASGSGSGLMNASFLNTNGDGPSSPSLSALTVQSAVAAGTDSVKEAASVSKP